MSRMSKHKREREKKTFYIAHLSGLIKYSGFSIIIKKLVMLAIKAYVGKNKISSAKRVTSSGD